MKSIMNWVECSFIPKVTKIASQRHLVAIRDSFIAIMPITMVGSIAVLLNVFFRDTPVTVIDMMSYGTMNGEKVLEDALKLLKGE